MHRARPVPLPSAQLGGSHGGGKRGIFLAASPPGLLSGRSAARPDSAALAGMGRSYPASWPHGFRPGGGVAGRSLKRLQLGLLYLEIALAPERNVPADDAAGFAVGTSPLAVTTRRPQPLNRDLAQRPLRPLDPGLPGPDPQLSFADLIVQEGEAHCQAPMRLLSVSPGLKWGSGSRPKGSARIDIHPIMDDIPATMLQAGSRSNNPSASSDEEEEDRLRAQAARAAMRLPQPTGPPQSLNPPLRQMPNPTQASPAAQGISGHDLRVRRRSVSRVRVGRGHTSLRARRGKLWRRRQIPTPLALRTAEISATLSVEDSQRHDFRP